MIFFGTDALDIIQDKIGKDDFIFGLDGPDQLEDDIRMTFTPESNDVYFGGRGHDSIWTFFGNDRLNGQRGSDNFDVCFGGDKRVVVDGGRGQDSLMLWDFDIHKVQIRERGQTTIIEQGETKVIVHQDVETWEFF